MARTLQIPKASKAYRLSNSKLQTWSNCHHQWYYKYILELRRKERKIELERGTWMHKLLQAHYSGKNWKKVHKKLTKQFYSLFEEEREMLGDLPSECARLMTAYVRNYQQEDKQYSFVAAELDETVKLKSGMKLQIIVDLLMEDEQGFIWAWDHKTRGKFVDPRLMMLDPQLSLYYDGLKRLGIKNLGGVVYNEIGTKAPTVPKLLVKGGLSKAKNIYTDTHTYMSEIRSRGLDPTDYADILAHIAITQRDRFFKRTTLPKDPPVLKTLRREVMMKAREMYNAEQTGNFPRSFVKPVCSYCDYQDLCIQELHGGGIEEMVKQNFVRGKKLEP